MASRDALAEYRSRRDFSTSHEPSGRGEERAGQADGGGRGAWLLVKRADAQAGRHSTPDPRRARSALSGRTLGQMRAAAQAGEAATWSAST